MVKDVACRCGYKQADEIDKKVIDKLMDYSLKPGLIKRAVKEFIAANNSNSSEKSLAQLKKEHSQLKTRIDRWYDAFEKGALDPDQLTERIRELRDRRELIEEQIGEAETAAATAQERLSSVDGLMVLINNFRLVWPNLDDMERKGLIKNIVKGVRVFPDNRIELEFFVD
jgi:site-specific DNA recombinase